MAIHRASAIPIGNDRGWLGRYPIEKLFDLIFDPHIFILPHTIKESFEISFSMLPDSRGVPPNHFILAGIDGTSRLTVMAAKDASREFVAALRELSRTQRPPYMDEDLYRAFLEVLRTFDPQKFLSTLGQDLEISVAVDDEVAMLHFPIWKPNGISGMEELIEKNLHIATFHIHATTEVDYIFDLLDPNNILSAQYFRTDPRTGGLEPDPSIHHPPISFGNPNGPVPITYLGERMNRSEACEILVGRYLLGNIVYNEANCKPYA